jgi:hypothetical protein
MCEEVQRIDTALKGEVQEKWECPHPHEHVLQAGTRQRQRRCEGLGALWGLKAKSAFKSMHARRENQRQDMRNNIKCLATGMIRKNGMWGCCRALIGQRVWCSRGCGGGWRGGVSLRGGVCTQSSVSSSSSSTAQPHAVTIDVGVRCEGGRVSGVASRDERDVRTCGIGHRCSPCRAHPTGIWDTLIQLGQRCLCCVSPQPNHHRHRHHHHHHHFHHRLSFRVGEAWFKAVRLSEAVRALESHARKHVLLKHREM